MNAAVLPVSLPPELAVSRIEPRGARAAQDFESYLIGTLLQSMEKTFASVPGEESPPGADDYNYLGTQALAEGIAMQGGFGIAKLICQYLPPHEGKGPEIPIGPAEKPLRPKVPASAADRSR